MGLTETETDTKTERERPRERQREMVTERGSAIEKATERCIEATTDMETVYS